SYRAIAWPRDGDNAAKTSAPLRRRQARQFPEDGPKALLVGSCLPQVASREISWSAAQRIDLDTGIIGQRQKTAGGCALHCLNCSILGIGASVFHSRKFYIYLGWRNQLPIRRRKNHPQLHQLAGVVSRQKNARPAGHSAAVSRRPGL